jgi:hypothetical protein
MISMTSRAGASALFTQIDAEVSPTDPDLGALIGVATADGVDVAIPALAGVGRTGQTCDQSSPSWRTARRQHRDGGRPPATTNTSPHGLGLATLLQTSSAGAAIRPDLLHNRRRRRESSW